MSCFPLDTKVKTMPETLKFRNTEMDWNPISFTATHLDKPSRHSPFDIVQHWQKNKSINVTLEPGDGTRYNLHLALINEDALLIVRHVNAIHDAPIAAIIINPEFGECPSYKAYALSMGNGWSNTFLQWWINRFLEFVYAGN